MRNFFFDLDGTILDVKTRYYTIYKEFIKLHNGKVLSIEKYWTLQRSKAGLSTILNSSGLFEKEEEYKKFLTLHREDFDYLKLDKISKKDFDFLSLLSKHHPIFLVSLRRNHENLLKQLKHLKIDKFFVKIFSGVPSEDSRWDDKISLIKNSGIDLSESILVGDTETDINAAKLLGVKSIAISSGLRDISLIRKAQPNFILEHVYMIKDLKTQ